MMGLNKIIDNFVNSCQTVGWALLVLEPSKADSNDLQRKKNSSASLHLITQVHKTETDQPRKQNVALEPWLIRVSPHTLQDTCVNQESSQIGNNPRIPRTSKDFPSFCLICKATSSTESPGLSLKLVALLKTR